MELLATVLLIGLGLALIAAEVWRAPGFNVLGGLNVLGGVGLLLIAFAVGFAFYRGGWTGGMLALLGAAAALGLLGYALWRSGAWDRLGRDGNAARDSDRARYLGQTGTTVTPLRPAGVVQVGEARIEVTTEGEFIAAGSRVRVVAMDRRRYFVRLAENADQPSPA